MSQSSAVPHLAEAYALAQCIAPSRPAASELVLRAFEALGAADRGRFAVLRSVIRSSGIDVASGDFAREPVSPPDLSGSGDTGDVSFVGVQAGRDLRNRLLPGVLGSLDAAGRVLVWLTASGITSAPDLARVLDLDPERAESMRYHAEGMLRRRLLQAADLHERRLLAAAERTEPTREATRRILDALLEPAPAALHARLAPDAPGVPKQGADSQDRMSPMRRLAFIFVVVLAASLLGYAIQSLRTTREPEIQRASDAVRQAIALADHAEPGFRTSSPEQAEVFVRDRIGWSIVAPIIDRAPLEGVTVVSTDDSLEIPVLFYGDGSGPDVTVVAYTYAFLERAAPVLYLDREIRRQISESGRFSLLDTGRTKALVFRNRDDIFVAVTDTDPETLQDAIHFPG